MDSSNVFYYSQMSPNDICTKADQYLTKRMSGGGDAPKVQPRATSSFVVSTSPPAELAKPSPEIIHYQSQPPPPQQQPQVEDMYTQKTTAITPRIGNKILIIEQEELLFKEIPVLVAEVINPANFYLVIRERSHEYDALKATMKTFYEENSFSLPINSDFYYAGKMEGTNEWGRVKVINITGNFCCALFIDEGVTFYMTEDKLFLLDDRFKTLPPRAFKAGLLGLNTSIWPYSITNQFKSIVLGKPLMAFIQGGEPSVYKCILANGMNVNEEISKLL